MNNSKELPVWEEMALVDKSPANTVLQTAARISRNVSASYLTHELRAPITAIRLGLEILQEQLQERLSNDERHMMAMSLRNTLRLEGLVNDIMDYSKIAAGKMSIKKEPCSAHALIVDAVEGLQATALAKGIKLFQERGEPLPRIAAEPRRIVQILMNLISNAIKYAPNRGIVRVSADLGKFEHDGTVVFKVKDNGCGMRPDDIKQLFDFFFQIDSKDQKEGTGLGLAIVRAMVELHGGKVWVESWQGVGSSFYFSVPIAASERRGKTDVYPRPVEYSGLLVSLTRRLNAFLAFFV
ncbi:MAG: sensor histidine kinase [Elusimicrobiota bacterium]